MSTLARIQDSGVILLGNRPSCLLLSSQDFGALINAISSSFSTSYSSLVSSQTDLIIIKSMNKEVSLAKKIRQEVKKDVHEEMKKNRKSQQVTFRKGATRQRKANAQKF